jgi:hypothetical protein
MLPWHRKRFHRTMSMFKEVLLRLPCLHIPDIPLRRYTGTDALRENKDLWISVDEENRKKRLESGLKYGKKLRDAKKNQTIHQEATERERKRQAKKAEKGRQTLLKVLKR